MIIGICGYGYSGSGALRDLFKEYSDIKVPLGYEFTLAYNPDGLLDLKYHLCENKSRFFSSDIAIKRFLDYVKADNASPKGWYKTSTGGKFLSLSLKYIDEITQLKWKGCWMHDRYLCGEPMRTIKYRILRKFVKKGRLFDRLYNREMYLSIDPENFVEKTQQFLCRILESMGLDVNETIMLDQPFPANNPFPSMELYPNAKAIIVDKDPRDMYLLLKEVSHSRWVPTEDVESFVRYYKILHTPIKESREIIYMRFEDLIYEYDSSIKRIENFCGISHHDRPRTLFDPSKSIYNTQLFNKYQGYRNDISYIERELGEWCYDFSKYPTLNSFGRTF